MNYKVAYAKEYEEEKDLVFHNPTAQHFEADWAEPFPNALKLVLGRLTS